MTRLMFDAVNPANLPDGSDLLGGYDDGAWPDYQAIQARFPGKRVIRFTVFAADRYGDVLDIEKGDATPFDAVDWVLARRALKADPTVYCSSSLWPAVKAAFAARGVGLPWWMRADYTRPPSEFPGDPREVAHQYTDTGRYDISVVADYWPGIDPPIPAPPVEDDMTPTDLLNALDAAAKSTEAGTPVPGTEFIDAIARRVVAMIAAAKGTP